MRVARTCGQDLAGGGGRVEGGLRARVDRTWRGKRESRDERQGGGEGKGARARGPVCVWGGSQGSGVGRVEGAGQVVRAQGSGVGRVEGAGQVGRAQGSGVGRVEGAGQVGRDQGSGIGRVEGAGQVGRVLT